MLRSSKLFGGMPAKIGAMRRSTVSASGQGKVPRAAWQNKTVEAKTPKAKKKAHGRGIKGFGRKAKKHKTRRAKSPHVPFASSPGSVGVKRAKKAAERSPASKGAAHVAKADLQRESASGEGVRDGRPQPPSAASQAMTEYASAPDIFRKQWRIESPGWKLRA